MSKAFVKPRLLTAIVLFGFLAVFPASTYAQDAPGNRANSGFEIPSSSTTVTAGDSTDASGEFGAAAVDADRQIVASNLLDILRKGGPLMFLIGICSFVLVVFVFERLISLRKGRIIPGPFTKRILEQLSDGELNRETAVAHCNRDNSPMAQVFMAGLKKWGRPAVEVEQAILDAGERSSNNLRRYLRLINGIATVTPLLGLLGTVIGMIHAFDAISTVAVGVTDQKTLIATGISQALLTTAAGMSVAIPALIAYMFFSSRVDKHVMEIDHLGQKIVNLVSAEALHEHKATSKQKKAA